MYRNHEVIKLAWLPKEEHERKLKALGQCRVKSTMLPSASARLILILFSVSSAMLLMSAILHG